MHVPKKIRISQYEMFKNDDIKDSWCEIHRTWNEYIIIRPGVSQLVIEHNVTMQDFIRMAQIRFLAWQIFTYNYTEIRRKLFSTFGKELMERQFHPRNASKWESWGFL